MKKQLLIAAVLAGALATLPGSPASATAPSEAVEGIGGHYEWQAPPALGPRARLMSPQRRWISDSLAQDTAMGGPLCLMPEARTMLSTSQPVLNRGSRSMLVRSGPSRSGRGMANCSRS